MRLLRGLTRALLLPADICSLSREVGRFSAWAMRAVDRHWIRLDLANTRPCRRRTDDAAEGPVCTCASRFANLFVLRLLCPWVRRPAGGRTLDVPGRCGESRAGGYRLPVARYLLALAVVAAFWVAVGTGGVLVARRIDLSGVRGARAAPPIRPARVERAAAVVAPARPARSVAPSEAGRAAGFARHAEQLIAQGRLAEARLQYLNARRLDPGNARLWVGLGRCVQRFAPDEARRAFTEALRLDPDEAEAHLGLARLARDQGDLATVLRHAGRRCELVRDDVDGHILLGEALLAQGHLADASAEAGAALTASPTNAAALCLAGALALADGRPQESRAHFEKALQAAPGNREAVVGIARAYRREGLHDKALAVLGEALRRDPANAAASVELASVQADCMEWDASIRTLGELTAREPGLLDLRAALGDLQLRTGRANDAYTTLRALLADRPDHVAGRTVLSRLYLRQGLPAPAVEEAEKALKRDPASQPARWALARAQMAQGAYAAARPHLVRLRDDRPRDLGIMLDLARCESRMGNAAGAAELARAAAAAHTNSPLPFILLGDICAERGELRQAMDWFRRALKLQPAHAVAQNNLAAAIALDEQADARLLAEALELGQAALRLLPENPAVADTVAWIMFRSGRNADALPLLSYAVRRMPYSPTVRYHLGVALHRAGELQAARSQLRTSLALASEFPEAAQARALLAQVESATSSTPSASVSAEPGASHGIRRGP